MLSIIVASGIKINRLFKTVIAAVLFAVCFWVTRRNPYIVPQRLAELETFTSASTPFVAQGAFETNDALKHFTDPLYGDRIVHALSPEQSLLTSATGHTTVHMRLSQLLMDPVMRGHSMHTYQQVLSQPEYEHVFGNQFNVLPNLPDANYVGSQLFFANSAHSGSPLHYAWGTNVFVQVNGKKRWLLVDPAYAFQLGCGYGAGGLYGTCPIFISPFSNVSIARNIALLPDGVPYMEFVLSPGDILVVPPLWLHAIENLEVPTIALSMRYINLFQAMTSAKSSLPSYQCDYIRFAP
jgi:hypothetical protein